MNRVVLFFFTAFFIVNFTPGIRCEETSAQFGPFGKFALSGSHHFDGDYPAIVQRILGELK